jgi:hypothetical protein
MKSILNSDEPPLAQEEALAVMENARERFYLWRKRAGYSALGLLLGCALVAPFLYGNPLHAYWGLFGRYLLLLCLGLLLVFVYCGALFLSAWGLLREARKTSE